jgi:hypothetical protein
MVRWMGLILLTGCMVGQMFAQALKEEGTAGQAPASGSAPVEPTSVASDVKAQSPLDSFTDFSALMVGTSTEVGENKSEGHIYRSGKLMRMEGPEGHGFFITDLSTLETYGISAGPCMHETHPFIRASPFAASVPGAKVERVPGGKETMDGHSCQVENVTISSPKPGTVPLKMTLWEADDLQGFPIRIDVHRGTKVATIRYKNVVLGPQDPTLFIHPKGCQGFDFKAPSKTSKSAPVTKKPATTPPPQ